jgi:glycosyltransferase involved in cell wall biosynthesis
MRIAIEGQRLFRKKKHGMDMVALELIKNLQTIDKANEYFIYVKPDEDDNCLSESPNFHIKKLDGGSYPLWEQISLPRAVEKDGCVLLHCTSNTAPIRLNIPLIVTLHDIIYMEKSYFKILSDRGTNYQKFGNVYRRFVVPRVLNKAQKIITVSLFEKNRIADFFGFKENDPRLVAVYNGVGEHFRKIEDQSELDRVKKLYHLPDKFIFFLGNTDPKKNTKGTLNAFSYYLKQTGSDHKLVMLDYERKELEKLLLESGDPDLLKRIVLTGYVVNSDLPAIYSLSSLFLYPSLRESFGIPILEAMRCGTPVITSNTSSMPEIAGEAAFLVNPFDSDEIANGIITIFGNLTLIKNMIENGFAQSEIFSWKSMAEQLLIIYSEIGNNIIKFKD